MSGRPVVRRAALCLATLWLAGCLGGSAADEALPPTIAVDSDTALALRKRADGFYLRLAHRRFNSLETLTINQIRFIE